MQQNSRSRRSSGARAVALDSKALLVRYRLLQLAAIIVAASLALGLHQIFAH